MSIEMKAHPAGRKKPFKLHIGTQIARLFLIIYAVFAVYPVFWTVMSSLKDNKTLFANIFGLPQKLNFQNYVSAWSKAKISVYFFNTLFITLGSLLLMIVLASLTAYVLARYKFKLNKFFTFMYISGLMIPGIAGIISLYIQLRFLNMVDSRGTMMLINAANMMPFSVFVLISFFKTIPKEIAEAGEIEGCNEFNLFTRVMLPLAKPGLIPVLIIQFMNCWSEVYFSLVILHTDTKKTLQLGLMTMQKVENQYADYVVLFAAVVIVMIPCLLLYAVFQKKIIDGINLGAVKG